MVDPALHDRLHRLRHCEEAWGPKLKRASLVAELELTEDELTPALRDLMQLWHSDSPSSARRRIRASFPATFVTAVAGMGSIRYDSDGFYAAIFSAAGMGRNQDLDRQWATLFLKCLKILDLQTFPQLDHAGAHRFVSRMLLHGGVPLDHLDELFDVVTQAIRETESTDPTLLHAWLVDRFEAGRLYRATVAVGRFLQYGGQYAVDFLDRSLDLLERVQANEEADEIRVGLPRRYIDRAIELRRLRQLPDRTRRSGASSSARSIRRRPEVRLDPYGVGPHLLLPESTDESSSGVWTVTMGDRVERVTVTDSGRGVLSELVAVPLTPQSPQVEVRSPSGTDGIVRVFDVDDPLLIFTADGRAIERAARVPPGPIWVLHPSERELTTSGGTAVEVHDVVPRWPAWRAARLHMSTAGTLGLRDGRQRYVEERRTASIAQWEPVDDVEAIDGPPLLRRFPDVLLPGAAVPTTWEIALSCVDGSDERIVHLDVGTDDLPLSLQEAFDPPGFEPLRVRARGPLGSSLRRDFRVVPGLRITSTPPIRSLTDEGLSPTRVELHGVDVAPLVLEPRERRARVDHPRFGSVLVAPPSIGVLHARSGSGATWRTSPLSLDIDKLADDPGYLLVRIPGDDGAVRLCLHAAGQIVQQLDPAGRARADGTRAFDLRRALDTIRHHGAGVLAVESSTYSGRVAVVKPSSLATGVYALGGGGVLQFTGVAAADIEAAVWLRLAPLRQPTHVDLAPDGPDAYWQLPDELIGLGPVRVLVRIDDPWVSEPLPAFPWRGHTTFDVDLPWTTTRLTDEYQHASYLAREVDEIDIGDDVGDAVKLFSLAYLIDAPRSGEEIRRDVAPQLQARPDDVLAAVLDQQLTGPELGRLLVDTQLVATRSARAGDADMVERLLARWLGAAAVALPAKIANGDVSAIRQLLLHQAGQSVEQLLDGGSSDSLARPVIDNETAALIQRPDELVHSIWRSMNVVPKVAFDADSQARAGFELLLALRDPRNAPTYNRLVSDADDVIRAVREHVLMSFGLRVLSDGVRQRIKGAGWQNLPAVSLALASLARLAPRVPPEVVFVPWHRKALSRLVRLAPALVGTDLLLAELAIQGAVRGD